MFNDYLIPHLRVMLHDGDGSCRMILLVIEYGFDEKQQHLFKTKLQAQ